MRHHRRIAAVALALAFGLIAAPACGSGEDRPGQVTSESDARTDSDD